jgi:hypothetical protein
MLNNSETLNVFYQRVKGLLQLARKDGDIETSLPYACLSQDQQVPERISQDNNDYTRKQKPQFKLFQKAKSSKVWFHIQSSLARMLDTIQP